MKPFTKEELEWILDDRPCPASDEIRRLEDKRILEEIMKELNKKEKK